jgi:nitrate reductase NapAB chaperone NapD
MIITGSVILVEPGMDRIVLARLPEFSAVTFHVKSETGTELVVNLEAQDSLSLEQLCTDLKASIPEIVDIAHLYVNFEEEIERIGTGKTDRKSRAKPELDG